MSNKMTLTCIEVLARAYYGLDLIGSATKTEKQARRLSIRSSLKLQWMDADHRITEQGLWELRRAINKQRDREEKEKQRLRQIDRQWRERNKSRA